MRRDMEAFEARARRALSREAIGFLNATAGSGAAFARNLEAFDKATVTPGLAVPPGRVNSAINLFGHCYAAPAGVAPLGLAGLVHPLADTYLASAASRMGLPYIYSSVSSTELLQLVHETGVRPWYQLYVPKNRELVFEKLELAKAGSCEVLVLTLDRPVPFRPFVMRPSRRLFQLPRARLSSWVEDRRRKQSKRHTHGLHRPTPELLDLQLGGAIDWDFIALLRRSWAGAFVLKGVLCPSLATRAAALGVDGLIVSNHGGRHLDCSPAPLDVLPAVVDSFGKRGPVLLDSGVRTGTDVLKAVDRGAACCLFGRPLLYAVALGGAVGVNHYLDNIISEIKFSFSLVGREQVFQLGNFGSRCMEVV